MKFENSGNPPGPEKDHRPQQFGNSGAVIISDYNVNWSGHCPNFDPFDPCYTLHNVQKAAFINSNRLYADGHVESTNTLEYYVFRPGPPAYYAY